MAAGLRFLCLFAAISLVWGDCYMHNPRGSNNRLNERSANRNNANRMFDSQVGKVVKLNRVLTHTLSPYLLTCASLILTFLSSAQNNNRGGYNAGDQNTGAFNQENQIYYMVRCPIVLSLFFQLDFFLKITSVLYCSLGLAKPIRFSVHGIFLP